MGASSLNNLLVGLLLVSSKAEIWRIQDVVDGYALLYRESEQHIKRLVPVGLLAGEGDVRLYDRIADAEAVVKTTPRYNVSESGGPSYSPHSTGFGTEPRRFPP